VCATALTEGGAKGKFYGITVCITALTENGAKEIPWMEL
jgi:hypothetical protein